MKKGECMNNVIALPIKEVARKVVELSDIGISEIRLCNARMDVKEWKRRWADFNTLSTREVNILFPVGGFHEFMNRMIAIIDEKRAYADKLESYIQDDCA